MNFVSNNNFYDSYEGGAISTPGRQQGGKR